MTKTAKRIIVISLSVILLVAIVISLYVFVPAFPLTSKWLSPQEVSSEHFKNISYLEMDSISQVNVFKDSGEKVTIKLDSLFTEWKTSLKDIKFKRFYKTTNEKSAYKGYKSTIEIVVFDKATNDLCSIYLDNNFNYGDYNYKCNVDLKALFDKSYKAATDLGNIDGSSSALLKLSDGRYVKKPKKIGYSIGDAKLDSITNELKSKVKITDTNEAYYLNGTSTYITKEVNGKAVPIMVLQAYKKADVLDDNSMFYVSINGYVDERYSCGYISEYVVGEKDGYVIYDFLPLISGDSGYESFLNSYSKNTSELSENQIEDLKSTRLQCVTSIKK